MSFDGFHLKKTQGEIQTQKLDGHKTAPSQPVSFVHPSLQRTTTYVSQISAVLPLAQGRPQQPSVCSAAGEVQRAHDLTSCTITTDTTQLSSAQLPTCRAWPLPLRPRHKPRQLPLVCVPVQPQHVSSIRACASFQGRDWCRGP